MVAATSPTEEVSFHTLLWNIASEIRTLIHFIPLGQQRRTNCKDTCLKKSNTHNINVIAPTYRPIDFAPQYGRSK